MKWRRLAFGAVAVATIAWLFGCGDDTPTSLGRHLRTPIDSLRVLELSATLEDSVYPVPVSLGRSPEAQIGQQLAYTAHQLYEFQIPTLVVRSSDSLRLDQATLVVRTDTLRQAPFTGAMRLALREVAAAGRAWATDAALDSVFTTLPPLEPDALAPDVVVVGAALVNHALDLEFNLDLRRIAGYDTVRAAGGTLTVNVAILFQGFATAGRGFIGYKNVSDAGLNRAQLIGFETGNTDAIVTVGAGRQRPVVLFDPTYSPGNKLVASDGYRLHSYLKFASLRTVLPESALVYQAELLLTQVDSTAGTSFGAGPQFGVVVPTDTALVFTEAQNVRPLSFRTTLVPLPGTTVTISVTPYLFDQQEGDVPNRGMILRLSDEGKNARHFEFYGTTAADSLRPRLHIVYGFPAQFEGGER